ncbi:Na+ dependent nucleoside transporter C-terminus-domain-containing protein [Chlamydoabsidia padenii]|nr:Na+ dependent nucleoside transporter C-terminus-domain-containing protein [Chlamydoabsidia padenii]
MDSNKVISGGDDASRTLEERRPSVTSFAATSSNTNVHRRESLVGGEKRKSISLCETNLAYDGDHTNIKMPQVAVNDGFDSGLEHHVDIGNTEKFCEYNPDGSEVYHEKKDWSLGALYNRYRCWCHLVMWLIFTGFLAAAYALQVPKGYNQENLILGLIYAWFCIYMIFNYIPTTVVTKPCSMIIKVVATPIMRFSPFIRSLLYVALVTVVMVVTVFSLPENEESNRVQRVISFFGIGVFIAMLVLTSKNRRAINWNTISGGMLLQFLLALFVFRSSAGHDIFAWASAFAQGYLSKAHYGTAFVFGDTVANASAFAVSVFPALIFFAATVQILYYFGALQWLLAKCSFVFTRLLGISGAEAVVAVASPFLGQGENALLIKPYLPVLTNAELHQVMTSGFATISGSVLYGYIALGIDGGSLLTSCIMSIPCSIAVSKLRYPETEEPVTMNHVHVPEEEEKANNLLDAAARGAGIGLTIVLSMAANLITLLALLYAVNAGLTWIGNFLTIENLTLQLITGYIFVPIAWLMGVENKDVVPVGQLLALKIWANEFVAYQELVTTYVDTISPRSHLITTYALCGFANLGSIGLQVSVLGGLAKTRTGAISSLAVSAMLCGAMSTWISACLAGMLL